VNEKAAGMAIERYQQLTPSVWQMITQVAPAMHQSRLFGVTSSEQAMAIMLKGYELGLSLTASFELIHVIQGRPTLSPRGCLALIQGSPLFAGIRIEDEAEDGTPTMCTVTMRRTNGFEYAIKFSMEDAARAGLVKDDSGWEKYPANMLRWRAVGFCADVVFPDVIGGMKRADEFGASITPEGDVIEAPWRDVTPPRAEPEPSDDKEPEATQPEPSPPVLTLVELTEKYGPEAILEANEGKIPGTQAEIDAVAARLGGG